MLKLGRPLGPKPYGEGEENETWLGKIFANPTQLGFMFQKTSAEIVPNQLVNRNIKRHIFAALVKNGDICYVKQTITWTPEPSKLGAGLDAQPPGVGEPLKTTEETVEEATKRSFSESKKSSKSSTGCGVVLRVDGRGVVVAKVRTWW